ncbi:MAG: FHA domain-containing protein [Ruminococcus sp.]|nr:FHA domain-containing protein [Ruminococcus sp.]
MEVLVIVLAVALVIAVATIIYVICSSRKTRFKHDIYFSGGADVHTGQMITDNNYFKGLSGEINETMVIGSNFSRKPSQIEGITVEINNLSISQVKTVTITDYLVIGRVDTQKSYSIAHDRAVSKNHCKLYVENNMLYLCDLGSSNHTYINKKIVEQPVLCKNGDLIKIGNTLLKIEIK